MSDYSDYQAVLLDAGGATRESAQAEYELLNDLGAPPGEHIDRWCHFLRNEGVNEKWLKLWRTALSPEDFRDVALVAGRAVMDGRRKNRSK